MPKGYCVRCKKSVELKNIEYFIMKNGRYQILGVCPNCGGKVSVLTSKDKIPSGIKIKKKTGGASRRSRVKSRKSTHRKPSKSRK